MGETMKSETILNAYDKASLRYGIGAEKARLKRQRATFRARILSRMGQGMGPMQNEHDAAMQAAFYRVSNRSMFPSYIWKDGTWSHSVEALTYFDGSPSPESVRARELKKPGVVVEINMAVYPTECRVRTSAERSAPPWMDVIFDGSWIP